jgi:phosphohistidine phosphatase
MKSKKLILIRHAKSSWEFNLPDKERPLTNKGITDAKLVSNYLKENISHCDAIFTSPAKRALSTCNIFLSVLNLREERLKIIDDLYDFEGERVINFIKSLNNEYKNVMIFGHNHAFTSISNIFGNKFIDNLPTAGVVVINFDINDWKKINKGQTELLIFPKQFK